MRKLFLFAAFLSLGVGAPFAASAAKFEVSGWIPYWREDAGVADTRAHLDQLTEINPFGYIVQPDGTVMDAMGVADEPWKSLIAEAKAKKVRVIPTIMWSDTEAIHRILGNQKSRIKLEDDITALAVNEGFDGVDIDFEGKLAEDKNNFSTFLRGLYQRMGKKWVMCTIESRTPISSRYLGVPPKDATVYANDFVQINKYCDRVRFMTYDQETIDQQLNKAALSAPYIPVADVKWVEKAIREAMKTIPKHKIVIGAATYGYEYEVTPLTESGYRYKKLWAFNPRYATDIATQLGLKPQRNLAGEMSFSYIPQIQVASPSEAGATTPVPAPLVSSSPAAVALATASFNMLWWSDATAIKQKVDLAKKLGVRGVAVFKFDGGEDPKMWEFLKQTK